MSMYPAFREENPSFYIIHSWICAKSICKKQTNENDAKKRISNWQTHIAYQSKLNAKKKEYPPESPTHNRDGTSTMKKQKSARSFN